MANHALTSTCEGSGTIDFARIVCLTKLQAACTASGTVSNVLSIYKPLPSVGITVSLTVDAVLSKERPIVAFATTATASATITAEITREISLFAQATATASVFAYLKEVAPPWVLISAPLNRTIFRRYDFGLITYTDPETIITDNIDELVLANTDGSEANNIDFIRRNDGWFVMATAVEFPPKPYELTFIHYDLVNKKTYSTTKRFFFKRELPKGMPSIPETTLKLPLGRNIFRRVDFGTIDYTAPTPLASTQIDEIVVGNMDINDENQIDFILRYDGWFAISYIVHYPKEPYEVTFIRHDNENKVTYSATHRMKLQREVKIF